MHFIKKYNAPLFFTVFLFLYFVSNAASSCPCFNMGYLQIEFAGHKNTECHIYKDGNLIYKMEIHDEKHSAFTTYTSCSLHGAYQEVYSAYQLAYLQDHLECVREILNACNGLHVNIFDGPHMDSIFFE